MRQFLLFALFVSILSNVYGTIHIVNNEVGATADYTTPTAALSAALSGDTLYIQPSATYYGDLTINKTVVIMGAGHDPSFSPYVSTFGNIVITNGASNTVVKGINITSISSSVGSVIANNIVFSGCKIENFSSSLFQLSSGTFNNWIFEGCIIQIGSGQPINLANFGANTIFRNNFINTIAYSYCFLNVPSGTLFDHNIIVQKGISVFNGVCTGVNAQFANNILVTYSSSTYATSTSCTSCTFNNNIMYPLGSGQFPVNEGPTNFYNQDPQLAFFYTIDTYQYDYDLHISDESIGNNAATDGSDIGIYGGIFNFNPAGIDGGSPHIIDFSLGSSSAPQGGTITIHLNASGSGQ